MSRTSPSSKPVGAVLRRLLLGQRRWLLCITALTTLATLLRLWGLGQQSLWFDETFTLWVARLSWSAGLRALIADGVHPPLFYWLQKLALVSGTNEALARLPAAFFGIASAPLLAWLARSWAGERAAFWATLLYALSPFHIWYSRDARMYSLLGLLTMLSIGAYWAWLQHLGPRPNLDKPPSSQRSKTRAREALTDKGPFPSPQLLRGAFVVVHGLAYLTHYFALWIPIIEGLHLIFHRRKYRMRLLEWALWQSLASLPLLGWTYLLTQRPVSTFGIGWIPRPLVWEPLLTMLNLTVGTWKAPPLLSGGLIALLLFLLGLGLRTSWPAEEARSLVVFWIVIPPALTLWLSLSLPFHIYMDRYLIMIQPPLLLLVAKGLTQRPRGSTRSQALWLALTAGPLLLNASLTGYHGLFSPQRFTKEAWRAAAAYLNEHTKADEVLVLRNAQMLIPFQIYPVAAPVRVWEWNRQIAPFERLVTDAQGAWILYWNAVGQSHEVIHEWVHPTSFEDLWQEDGLSLAWRHHPEFALVERRDFAGLTLFHLRRKP